MSRDICIYQDFLSDAHRDKIREAAQAAGFTAHFFTGDQFEEASACLQHCEVLYAQSPQLLRTAPAMLKWFCCSSAGADPYCKNDGIFANPDCLLTNSAGAYGATISEHLIMTLLMLMRRMPAYLQGGARHEWTAPMAMRSIQGSPITCLGTGNRLDPSMLRVGNLPDTAGTGCPLSRIMRKELRRRGITDLTVVYSLEVPVEPAGVPAADNGRHPPASMAFVPPAAGFLMASYAVRDLLGLLPPAGR